MLLKIKTKTIPEINNTKQAKTCLISRTFYHASALAYKDTNKNKQTKTAERADKLGFVQTFLFLHRFLFFSSVSLLYVSGPYSKIR